jgi:2-octaprenyl-6-methoxyphenol hydroxylase
VVKTPLRDVRAALVVAADGSRSLVREKAGIAVRRWTYDQSAFVTTLAHARPHGNTSTEFHAPGGPFTLVPLPGDRSSLVWVDRPEEVDRVVALDPGPLAREIERRAHNILGRMSVDGPRGTIPMEGMVAHSFGTGAVVLVGEAGHRFPPIGAQGLNLGLRDVEILRELLGRGGKAGLEDAAGRYDRRRRLDVGTRTLGVDVLNRSLLSDAPPFAVLRTVGLTAAHGIGPLRRTMMRLGLGS